MLALDVDRQSHRPFCRLPSITTKSEGLVRGHELVSRGLQAKVRHLIDDVHQSLVAAQNAAGSTVLNAKPPIGSQGRLAVLCMIGRVGNHVG